MEQKKDINPVIASAHLQRVIMNAPLSHSDRQEALIYLRSLTEHAGNVKEQQPEIKKEMNGLKNEQTTNRS